MCAVIDLTLVDLLMPHFTSEEICKLIAFGMEGYEDIHAEEEESAEGDFIVYDFVKYFLTDVADEMENFNENVGAIIGRKFTTEEFDALTRDMDERWFGVKEYDD